MQIGLELGWEGMYQTLHTTKTRLSLHHVSPSDSFKRINISHTHKMDFTRYKVSYKVTIVSNQICDILPFSKLEIWFESIFHTPQEKNDKTFRYIYFSKLEIWFES